MKIPSPVMFIWGAVFALVSPVLAAGTEGFDVIIDGVNAQVRASSMLLDDGDPGRYSPIKAFDGDPTTAWAEGSASDGAEEWIEIEFPEPHLVSTIEIANGYQKSEALYYANNRIQFLDLIIDSDKGLLHSEFNADWTNTVRVNRRLKTIRLRVSQVEQGEKYSDLCVSEIRLKLARTGKYGCDHTIAPGQTDWSYCQRENQTVLIGPSGEIPGTATGLPLRDGEAADVTVEQLPDFEPGEVLLFRITAQYYWDHQTYLHFVGADARPLLLFHERNQGDDGSVSYNMGRGDFNGDGLMDAQFDGESTYCEDAEDACPDFERSVRFVSRDGVFLRDKLVPQREPNEEGIPHALLAFLDEFEQAVLSHDKGRMLELMDKRYRAEQHDDFLEGQTDQFLNEFFDGKTPDGRWGHITFSNISRIERLSLEPAERGHSSGLPAFVVSYRVEADGVVVIVSWNVTESPWDRYGLYGAVG